MSASTPIPNLEEMQEPHSIHEGELDRTDVRSLLDQHFREMRAGSPPSACHVMPADSLDRPDIIFLSLRGQSGELRAVGALRRLEPGHGEIKSMRATDSARGTGAGRAMLHALTSRARDEEMTRLYLETGNDEMFAPALALYRSAGFVECGPFSDYRPTDFTVFLTREI
ncbi:GNAT family N-acetyltransferase [Sphingomicrobium sediminis]|uniref:GNAT family N-acetyltransferase n=1 Tax=Sphingomicrobium sediminis TaxID=2950949 RepID=A0A9X2EF55_9SPHN|nr:GNAT family N-acetyltransferase [Sphingomicrobium sediminis]MCM8556430.1 GNAT family N-acetyltransferase [Sphingomicrobium sediminis]